MTKEEKFYKALEDLFIGARIEGTGGFVGLMRIKLNYYRKIDDILKKDIELLCKSILHSESNFLTNSTLFSAAILPKVVQFITDILPFIRMYMKRFIQLIILYKFLKAQEVGYESL